MWNQLSKRNAPCFSSQRHRAEYIRIYLEQRDNTLVIHIKVKYIKTMFYICFYYSNNSNTSAAFISCLHYSRTVGWLKLYSALLYFTCLLILSPSLSTNAYLGYNLFRQRSHKCKKV